MLQTIRCIRFADVLMDEHHNLFIFCNNCHLEFNDFKKYNFHLTRQCNGIELLVASNSRLTYKPDCCEHKIAKSTNFTVKEYQIYNINDVHAESETIVELKDDSDDDIAYNIGKELLDSRWYNDLEVNTQSEKENNSNNLQINDGNKIIQNIEKSQIRPSKRLTMSQTNNKPITRTIIQIEHKPETKYSTTNEKRKPAGLTGPLQSKIPKKQYNPSTLTAINSPNKTQQTEELLNKLQNLGLEVKRTSVIPKPPPDIIIKPDTLELVKKLQSKGIQLSVIPKNIHEAKKPRLE